MKYIYKLKIYLKKKLKIKYFFFSKNDEEKNSSNFKIDNK
jgi:hypothetical protein